MVAPVGNNDGVPEYSTRDEHPVLAGLLALIGVGLAVGLVLGGVALGATKMLGVGEDGAVASSTENPSFYLPRPSRTEEPDGPQLTLGADPAPEATRDPSNGTTTTPPAEEGEGEITLSAGTTAVAPMERIDLTGVYPGGEGQVLQVEKFSGGGWQEFPVTVVVSNETFATYVQTSFQGVNRFRVVDNESGEASNEVKVTVG